MGREKRKETRKKKQRFRKRCANFLIKLYARDSKDQHIYLFFVFLLFLYYLFKTMVHYFYDSEQKEDQLKWYIDCEWANNLDFETNPRDLDICTITLNNVNDYWTGIGKFIPDLFCM